MLKEEVLRILQSVDVTATAEILEAPSQEEYGDIAFPCFDLARIERKNPHEIANDIVKRIQVSKHPLLLKLEARGGYVNFFFYWERITESVLKKLFSKTKMDTGDDRRYMIEFSQPNTAHGLHIGHARATMLGESIARIMDYAGYDMVKVNYYGDFGAQVSKTIVAYLKWAKGKPDKKPDMWLWDYYVKFHEDAQKNPQLEEEAKEILRKLEQGDKEMLKVWKKVRALVLRGIRQTYKRLGVSFDKNFYESQFFNFGKDIVETALQKGIAQESEGAVVTNLEKYGLPNTVLLRADGTTLYQTRDIGMAVKNFNDYKLDGRIYVVDARQETHFKQVFKILELLGYTWANNLHHLSFGVVSLPEGMMASRSGRVVKLDEFLDELEALAYKEVEKRNPKMRKKIKRRLAKKIALGALVFALLKIEPERNIIFNKEEMVQFEGDTGPYLQYAYTRCMGILRRVKKHKKTLWLPKINQHEKRLVKKFLEFNDAVSQSAIQMRPHILCSYIYSLATEFNSFYENCPVISAEDGTRDFRLTLVEATKDTIKQCLNLLAIPVPEKM